MQMINPITNVNNTPYFGNGVQTNRGVHTPSPRSNIVEGRLIAGFAGTVGSTIKQIKSRAQTIEAGLTPKSKIDYFA